MKNRRLRRQLTASVLLLGLAIAPLPARSRVAESAPPAAESPYLLPWEGGKKILVSQTQGGTHAGAMSNAIDFVLNRGDKVLAARAGKVIFREDRYLTCGGPELATRGNYVVIDHGDQTSALYLHLERIDVSVGQTVQQGEPIGTSGLTGWTGCSPHLHFQIQQNWGVWFSRSLPVAFGDPDVRGQDPNGTVKALQSYVSGNRAPAGAPAPAPAVPGQPAGGPRAAAVVPPPGPLAAPAAPSATPTASPAASVTLPPGRPADGSPATVGGGSGVGILGQRLTVTDPSSVRERPATDSPRVGMIFPGQEFEPLEVVAGQPVEPPESRWVKVKIDSAPRPGFLYAGLIKGISSTAASPVAGPGAATPSSAAPPSAAAATPAPASTGPAVSRLTVSDSLEPGQWQSLVAAAVREQPTRQSARIGGLDAGTDVRIVGIVPGEMVEAGEVRWARIAYRGGEGYLYFGVLVTGQLHAAPVPPLAVAGLADDE